MHKLWHWIYGCLVVCCIGIMCIVGFCYVTLPDAYTVASGEDVALDSLVYVSADVQAEKTSISENNKYNVPLRLFGVVPVKQVTVSVTPMPMVTVCGTPFGIKLYTEGVLVVGMSDVMTASGGINPAATAGIRIGDTILSIDGKPVTTNEEVAACVNACNGRAICLRVRREGVEFDASFVPVHPADGEGYRAGMWVRDSTAGIGTLTFYDAGSGVFAGLGHPVCDADTGQILSISTGEIVPACILSVKPSVKGTPGELQGVFETGSLGQLTNNETGGLYGYITASPQTGCAMEIARKQEVKTGYAQIYTTVTGTTPQLYDVSIKQVRYNTANDTRGMVIQVTDKDLLACTGGIVQGMSGSPIIQNGKLIGAVTHVLVDNPTKGYGIFAENMLETARSVEQFKEAG